MDPLPAPNPNADALLADLKRFLPDGMTLNSWAVAAGVSRAVWGDIRRHGNPSRRTLEKLLTAAGSSLAEFEALRIGARSPGSRAPAPGLAEPGAADWRGAQPGLLPLRLAHDAGLFCGLTIMTIEKAVQPAGAARPASLVGDPEAYAFIMAGDAMWPRFRAGRALVVTPTRGIKIGDDVLLSLSRGERLFALAELVARQEEGWTLRQFTPARTAHLAAADVMGVAKVLGEAI